LCGGALVLTTSGVVAAGYRMIVTGSLTLDVGWGRTYRPLGPVLVQIAAPPDVVYDVVSGPYLGRTPRSLASKLEVLEKGKDMVLAAHYTPTVAGLVAKTVETVRFPTVDRIEFRLVRGPVPYLRETFLLSEVVGGTQLEYTGEIGADFWVVGRWWANQVARKWEAAVDASLASIKSEAERRAKHRRPGASLSSFANDLSDRKPGASAEP
jgi:hypothetical protein